MKIQLENGKYTYIYHETGHSQALRHGQPWRDLTGDNFVYALAAQLEQTQEKLRAAEQKLAAYESS